MKGKAIRTIFRLLAAAVALAVAAVAAVLLLDRKPAKALPKPEACPAVSNAIDSIIASFAPSPQDVKRLDVRKMSVARFAAVTAKWSPEATLWIPGESDWLVVGAERGTTNRLDRVIDAFAAVDTPFSLPELFANYVGTLAEVRPAFAALDPEDGVVPELFVTRDIPKWNWLDATGVETDILAKVTAEMRSMQVVRRLVLEGNILSRKQQEDAAIAKWANAFRRAPNDTLLLERMHHLRKNAEVFYRIGKYGMASKCYETLCRVNPRDRVAMVNLSECLKCLGKRELAEAVRRKAESIKR